MTESERYSALFRLDISSGVPFYRQIIDQVMLAVADGRLKPGTQLPMDPNYTVVAKFPKRYLPKP